MAITNIKLFHAELSPDWENDTLSLYDTQAGELIYTLNNYAVSIYCREFSRVGFDSEDLETLVNKNEPIYPEAVSAAVNRIMSTYPFTSLLSSLNDSPDGRKHIENSLRSNLSISLNGISRAFSGAAKRLDCPDCGEVAFTEFSKRLAVEMNMRSITIDPYAINIEILKLRDYS